MEENGQKDQLMTVQELAAYLKVAKGSIYKRTRLRTGGIPHLRTCGGIRFDKQAVIEFFKHSEQRT